MSRVFVVHHQQRYDSKRQRAVDAHDLRPAYGFGEIVHLLPNEATPFEPDKWLPKLVDGLADICPEDYLLLVGNPALIAWAAGIAADCTDGMLRLLQWDRKKQVYEVVSVRLWEQEA